MPSRRRTFALIPARGGSKGIPRKNVKLLAGKPLIAWTIEAALASPGVDAVVVSTDDAEIAGVARHAGAQVPFMRPPEFARDDSPGIAPVLHAIDQLPDYDAVLLLQPTSPLRTTSDIDACLALAAARSAMSVVSVCEPATHPCWTYSLTDRGTLTPLMQAPMPSRRQDLPPVYALNGAMYFADVGWLRTTGTLVSAETIAYVMPHARSVDLDTPFDWLFAETLLRTSP